MYGTASRHCTPHYAHPPRTRFSMPHKHNTIVLAAGMSGTQRLQHSLVCTLSVWHTVRCSTWHRHGWGFTTPKRYLMCVYHSLCPMISLLYVLYATSVCPLCSMMTCPMCLMSHGLEYNLVHWQAWYSGNLCMSSRLYVGCAQTPQHTQDACALGTLRSVNVLQGLCCWLLLYALVQHIHGPDVTQQKALLWVCV